MRKVSFAFAVGFVLAACGGGDDQAKTAANPPAPTTTTPPAPTATDAPKPEEPKPAALSPAEAQKQTGMGLMAAMNAHDAKKLASFYSDSAVLKVVGMPDVNGRDAIQAQYQKMFDSMSNMKTATNRVFVTKDGPTIVEWASNGKHSGDMFGVKASEKDIGFQGVSAVWFTPDGSQIKEEHVYHDVGTIMSQIGVSKQKARPVPTLSTTPPQVLASTGSPDEQKNIDASTKMFGAFEKKSDADFASGLADSVEWDDMTQPDTMKGKESGKKFFKMITTAFPDVKIVDAKAWGVGDYVVVESAMTGTHKGVLFGTIQPTKKTVNMHGIDIIQYKDGKAVHGWSYGNSAEMMMQLGLMPQPGSKAADAKTGGTTTSAPPPAKK